MGLIQLLSMFHRQSQLQQIASRLASASMDAVSRRVESRAAGMTPPEARGYIRARSASVVRPRVQRAVDENPRLAACQSQLVELTTAEVVQRVLTVVRRRRSSRQRHAA